MKMKIIWLPFFVLMFIAGSAFSQTDYEVEKSRVIYKPYDQVWWYVTSWFGLHGIYIKNARYEHGFIDTVTPLDTLYYQDYMDISEVRKSVGPEVKLENPFAVFNIILEIAQRYHVSLTRQDRNQVVVHAQILFYIEGNIYDENGKLVSTRQYLCNSTGIVEKDLFDYIDVY